MPIDLINQKQAKANPVHLQRELFNLFDEFFISVTGKSSTSFANCDDVLIHIKNPAHHSRINENDVQTAYENLGNFYVTNGLFLYKLAKQVAGLRLVLGGGSYFLGSQLTSVQKILLYADTVLIPDPVFARIEDHTGFNKFNHVELLRSAFHLLKLKPLVDADLPYQAVFVFPSYEASLTENDPITQNGIDRLTSIVMSHHLGVRIETLPELFEYATRNQDAFLSSVANKQLFIAPGQDDLTISLPASINLYRDYIKERRTQELSNEILKLSSARLVALGISERLLPQFHLQENANELNAHPLLPLSVAGHYFRLCAEAFNGRAEKLGLLSSMTTSTIDALNKPNFSWLGNVPFDEIVRLRLDNENENFRRSLDSIAKSLNNATLEDSEKVVAEFTKELSGMMAAHQKKVRQLDESYQKKYKQLAVPSILTAASIFIPAIAPFIGSVSLGAAAIGLTGKYMKDKHDEYSERTQLARSLLGVLTVAKRS